MGRMSGKNSIFNVRNYEKMIACCLFDLDGVIVDTARYHYLAWASLARDLGFEFTPAAGEATKGVSRMASLDIVLRAGGMDERFSPAEKERLAAEKNARYLAYVSAMTPAEVLPGAVAFLRDVRAHWALRRRTPGRSSTVVNCVRCSTPSSTAPGSRVPSPTPRSFPKGRKRSVYGPKTA